MQFVTMLQCKHYSEDVLINFQGFFCDNPIRAKFSEILTSGSQEKGAFPRNKYSLITAQADKARDSLVLCYRIDFDCFKNNES